MNDIVEVIAFAVLVVVCAFVLTLLIVLFGRSTISEEYANCRRIASIEVCVAHVGLEKKEKRND